MKTKQLCNAFDPAKHIRRLPRVTQEEYDALCEVLECARPFKNGRTHWKDLKERDAARSKLGAAIAFVDFTRSKGK